MKFHFPNPLRRNVALSLVTAPSCLKPRCFSAVPRLSGDEPSLRNAEAVNSTAKDIRPLLAPCPLSGISFPEDLDANVLSVLECRGFTDPEKEILQLEFPEKYFGEVFGESFNQIKTAYGNKLENAVGDLFIIDSIFKIIPACCFRDGDWQLQIDREFLFFFALLRQCANDATHCQLFHEDFISHGRSVAFHGSHCNISANRGSIHAGCEVGEKTSLDGVGAYP